MKKLIKPAKIMSLFIFVIIILGFAPDSKKIINPKITMLEIGSTTCIPCKKMQPILKSLEKKYGSQLKVIFHDVNKNRDIASKYNVKMIPTQIFLDNNSKELMRHVGYYPEKEIDVFLKSKGLIIN